MSFLNPGFMWAMLLLAPLIAAYLLKVRPTRRPVTAMFLWSQIYSEKKATALLHKLRDMLSLLLLGLALIGLVIALTQPRLGESSSTDVVIIIDASAAMSAKVGGESRIDLARDEAKRLIRQLHGTQRAAVVSAGSELRFHAQLTDDVRQLLQAVDDAEATASRLNWRAIAELVAQPGWLENTKVVLLTDRSHDGREHAEGIEIVSLGEAAGNVGIVAADLRATANGNEQLMLFYQLASSFEKVVEIDMLLEQDGRLRRVIPVTVNPGENEAEQQLVQGGPGRWTARLSIDDALALDNAAYLAAPQPKPVSVAVRATDPYFLQHSVFAFQQGGDHLALASGGQADIVIAQGNWPADAQRAVVFQPTGEAAAWSDVGDELQGVLPRLVVKDHPALRFLDVESMQFAGARQLQAAAGSLVLVEDASGVPLIWEYARGDARCLVVNADVKQSSLVFSATFPILVHGLAMHLAGKVDRPAASYASGDVVSLATESGRSFEVLTPGGEVVVVPASFAANQLGFYEVGSGDDAATVAVSLLSREATLGGEADEGAAAAGVTGGYPPEYLLILLGAMLLVGESVLYHRRKVG